MSFKKVDPKQSFPKMEEEILKFWEENKIFEKSVEKNSGDKSFIFYEGPPTANGKPGLHHVLARAFKDIIPRYKTMKGYRVERKAGWDTHGLPVEIEVEKELGLKNKQDVENIIPGNPRESIIKFNEKCKESVWKYKDLWEKMTKRMAYWVDMENPYITYENKYIESVWWVIAQIFKTKNKKGESLVYKGHKVVPYCYRCGTSLSTHEVAQGYKKVTDNSVYVKFKAKPNKERGIDDNTYFLVWTTTPWTLPGNVALAIGSKIKYAKVHIDKIEGDTSLLENIKEGEKYIIAWETNQVNLFVKNKDIPATYRTGDDNKSILNVNSYKARVEMTHDILKTRELLDLEYYALFDYYKGLADTDVNLAASKNQVNSDTGKSIEDGYLKPFTETEGIRSDKDYKERQKRNNAYKVYAAKFVSTQEGTGIVHIAPAFGEDDANVGRENDLPTLLTVDSGGKINAEIPKIKGIPVKKKNDKNRYEVDDLIVKDLKKRGLLFKEEPYEHDYPFCWRCDMPLIYYAKPSWFIRMSELSDELVNNNENINWIPAHIKKGRFGEWLENVKDWAISRERYWGTPLPIWTCEKCGEQKAIESIKELEDLSGQKLEDLHKPYIDDVKIKCSCGEEMTRVPEVLDVWFDSGSMPLAQFNYPNNASKEDREKIESGKFFPADYISEAIDQTRGWFYTLHAIATLLNKSGKVPTGHAFKNVICLGHILDAKGQKMSKSKGNIIDPIEVMDEYGSDMLRWMLFTINQPGLPKKFDVKGMKDIMNRVFRMLWNSYSFFVMYANIDKFNPSNVKLKSNNLLDKWIISELNTLVKEVDDKLDNYNIYSAAGNIEAFIDNLSNWYIRRSRKRFWKSENDKDKNQAYQTLHFVLVELSKLMAPFTPFISEEIYKNLTGEESVHLAEFPVADEKLISDELNGEMNKTRTLINAGLKLRANAGIKVRQPLMSFAINEKLKENFINIIKEEVNVKNVTRIIKRDENKKVKRIAQIKTTNMSDVLSRKTNKPTIEVLSVELDTNITPELRLEGIAREIIRHIQQMRKEADYEIDNRIKVSYSGVSEVFDKFGKEIAKEVLAGELKSEKLKEFDLEKEFSIENQKIKIQIKR